MNSYRAFIVVIGYLAFVLFLLAVISIGGVLSIAAAGIALVGYYPFRVWEWVLSKFTKDKK